MSLMPLPSELNYWELAERGGFEPPIRFNPYNGLANRRCISNDGVFVSRLSLFYHFRLS